MNAIAPHRFAAVGADGFGIRFQKPNRENIWRQASEIFMLDGFQDGESDPRFLSHLL
jgi:hypothetical protein